MYNNKTSVNYCSGGILISHSFWPFQVLRAMPIVTVEVDYLEMTMESAILDVPNVQYFFLVLEGFLHLKVQTNLKTWLAETDNSC